MSAQHVQTIASTAPATTGDTKTKTETRRGRKTKLESIASPYSVATRESGRHFMMYTGLHPETGTAGRQKIALVPAGSKVATLDPAEAQRLAAGLWEHVQQLLGEQRRGETYLGPKSFGGLAVLYCAALAANTTRSSRTNDGMQDCILKLLKFTCLGEEPDVRTFTTQTVLRVTAELQAATFPPVPRIPHPHHPTDLMTRRMLREWRYMMDWVRRYQIPRLDNVVHTAGVMGTFKASRRSQLHFHTPIEIAAMRDAARALTPRRDALGNLEILELYFYTGCRHVEPLLLRPRDIDFAHGVIRLVNAKQDRYVGGRREWFDIEGPDDIDKLELRELKMWPDLFATLWAYDQQYGATKNNWPWFFPCSSSEGFKLSDPRTHTQRTKGPYSFLQTVIRRAKVKVTNLTYKGFHALRHTYVSARRHMYMPVYNPVTKALEPTQVTLGQIQAEIGHVDGSPVTMRVYNKVLYNVPPNTVFELDWTILAELCKSADLEARQRLAGVPAIMAAHFRPIASHASLLSNLATLPIREDGSTHIGPR